MVGLDKASDISGYLKCNSRYLNKKMSIDLWCSLRGSFFGVAIIKIIS